MLLFGDWEMQMTDNNDNVLLAMTSVYFREWF